MKGSHKVAILAILSVTVVSTAHAASRLSVSFTDPPMDQTGAIDVATMVLDFDPASGAYRILVTTTAEHPFLGPFRVNINLYNPDLAIGDPGHSSFHDVCDKCEVFSENVASEGNDNDLSFSTTEFYLVGVDPTLTFWNAGDRVVTSTWANLGNPPDASFFRSSVLNLPFTFLSNEDCIACDSTFGIATIVAQLPWTGKSSPCP